MSFVSSQFSTLKVVAQPISLTFFICSSFQIFLSKISNLTSLENHIVDSIRNPLEVKSLRREYESHNFSLISVDAKPEVRYERLKQRNRAGDSSSWEEFVAQEKLEESSSDPNKQQLFATINEADHHIDNSGSLSDLENKISKIIDNL